MHFLVSIVRKKISLNPTSNYLSGSFYQHNSVEVRTEQPCYYKKNR